MDVTIMPTDLNTSGAIFKSDDSESIRGAISGTIRWTPGSSRSAQQTSVMMCRFEKIGRTPEGDPGLRLKNTLVRSQLHQTSECYKACHAEVFWFDFKHIGLQGTLHVRTPPPHRDIRSRRRDGRMVWFATRYLSSVELRCFTRKEGTYRSQTIWGGLKLGFAQKRAI
ncbi:hypothetical protein BO86DRAFT_390014 [Aspergillus japonicus CBS 114.51]|uniref:Uncharacterized protein n=1 Tax=Aspergillus japonicus CBS 114.51 TaxID=1448312 RepID=A0A8T8WZK3_ASPJA|nr:hypothetical protein BO86DRAFT_390014 [Aspergillus japonicus CBS 114.51]RAH80822.1 hypothetical protein BO86DRAFT_390014 [Aspergillus japonicus CBS 114.51]